MKKVVRRRKGINRLRKKTRSFPKFYLQIQKRAKRLVIIVLSVVAALFLIFSVSRLVGHISRKEASAPLSVHYYRDLNAVHLRHAVQNGIIPFESDKAFYQGVGEHLKNDKLVRIKRNRLFIVKPLSHSHPYLVPLASNLLEDIGKRFREKLSRNGKPPYYFQVTSLLRTRDSQRRLRKTNGNATQNTSHLYGTTFDIAYRSLTRKSGFWSRSEIVDGEAIRLLSEAIGELRREGRCKVVTERKEKCFHITVVK